jgi:hypothetical protein
MVIEVVDLVLGHHSHLARGGEEPVADHERGPKANLPNPEIEGRGRLVNRSDYNADFHQLPEF